MNRFDRVPSLDSNIRIEYFVPMYSSLRVIDYCACICSGSEEEININWYILKFEIKLLIQIIMYYICRPHPIDSLKFFKILFFSFLNDHTCITYIR